MSINEKMTAIADAIRAKTGGEDVLTLDEMATEIPKVYEAGWKSLMDGVQNFGDRANYSNAFSQWNSDAIYPTHDMICSVCQYMFYNVKGKTFDLSARLKECNVRLDTSSCKSFDWAFYSCNSLTIPELDTRGANIISYLCSNTLTIVTVENLILRDDGSQSFDAMFDWSTSIENIKITGVIGQNGFSVSSLNKLTHDSLMSILNALQDKSEDTSGTIWTVTLGGVNIAKLTEDEIAIAESKGWEVA